MSVHFLKSRNLFFSKWREEGKEKRRYFKTGADAQAFEAERLACQVESDERLSLGELAIKYFQSKPDFNIQTKKKIVGFLSDGGAGSFMRDKYAESLNRRDLNTMRQTMWQNNVGNATINKFQAYIRAILAWGVDQELISLNPWRDFKRLKEQKPIIQPEIADLKKLYAELPEYLQWAVKTTYCLALRPGKVELFNLLWTAFNWRRGVVVIRQGKSGKLKTVVPPPAYLQEAYERYQKDMAAGIPWVVHRQGQKVLAFTTAWKQANRRAGTKLRPYDIRHLSASEMLAGGADIVAVAAQLGHANVATTGAYYAHVTRGSQAKAASLMPALDSDTSGDTKVIQNQDKNKGSQDANP